jgi:hypothetical protein
MNRSVDRKTNLLENRCLSASVCRPGFRQIGWFSNIIGIRLMAEWRGFSSSTFGQTRRRGL